MHLKFYDIHPSILPVPWSLAKGDHRWACGSPWSSRWTLSLPSCPQCNPRTSQRCKIILLGLLCTGVRGWFAFNFSTLLAYINYVVLITGMISAKRRILVYSLCYAVGKQHNSLPVIVMLTSFFFFPPNTKKYSFFFFPPNT